MSKSTTLCGTDSNIYPKTAFVAGMLINEWTIDHEELNGPGDVYNAYDELLHRICNSTGHLITYHDGVNDICNYVVARPFQLIITDKKDSFYLEFVDSPMITLMDDAVIGDTRYFTCTIRGGVGIDGNYLRDWASKYDY